MTLLARKSPGPRPARHVEIWGHLEENNRFLRRLAVAACAWAFLALAGAAYAFHVGLYEPLAFLVDAQGRATFAGRLRESAPPSVAEVRYVAKEFLRRYAGVNSLTIESDMAEAWNLMTAELQAEHRRMLDTYEHEHGKEFVAYVKEQGIQMTLELRDERLQVTEHRGKVFTVRLIGTARTYPLGRVGSDSAYAERELEAFVTLVRCPRTEKTPNGLLVAKVASRFFVAGDRSDDGRLSADGPSSSSSPGSPRPEPPPAPAPVEE